MRAYIDYLRLATWQDKTYLDAVADTHRLSTTWRPGGWLQYKGKKSDHFFYGVGEQRGTRHYVLQASGDDSPKFAQAMKSHDGLYCTRIDLQITIERGKNYDARVIYDDCKDLAGDERATSLILSDTGSTVYLGDRTSDSFARLYTKDYDAGKFVRLEFECKGQTARNIWASIVEGTLTETQAYQHIFGRFRVPDYIRSRFEQPDANGELIRVAAAASNEKRLEWLMGLGPTIRQMANDHDTGQLVRTWLDNLMQTIDKDTH